MVLWWVVTLSVGGSADLSSHLDRKIAEEIREHRFFFSFVSESREISDILRNKRGKTANSEHGSPGDAKYYETPEGITDRVPPGTWFPATTAKDSPWVFLGPSPATGEYWSDGTVSGRVSFILPHPTDPQSVYIASAGGGVWKTTDGGATWVPLTDHLPALTGGALAMDPNNPQILYYGTGEFHNCWDCGYGDGLYRSPDGGMTWEKIASTSQVGNYIARIVIPAQRPSWIYVANRSGLAFSSDSGATWTWLRTQPATDVLVHPLNPDTVFAATRSSGIYRSTDGGTTWNLISSLPTSGYYRAQLAYAPSNPDVIYASFGATNYSLLGLYVSVDGGFTWDLVQGAPDYLGGQGFYNHTLAVDPADPLTVFAGGTYPYDASTFGLVRITITANGSDYSVSSFEDITDRGSNGRLHPDIHHVVFGPDTALWVATDGGVWVSYNRGSSWVNRNATLALTQFYTLAVHPTDPNLIVGGTQDNGSMIRFNDPLWQVYASGDGGPTTWIHWNGSDRFFKTYVNMQYLSRYRLTSGYPNPSWVFEPVPEPWQDQGDQADWANGVLENVGDSVLFVGTERVWMSTDAGDSWTAISGSLSSGSVILSLAAASAETLYVGLADGSVFYTPSQGLTWIDRSPLLSRTYERINELAVNPSNPQEVYGCVGFWFPNSAGPRVIHTLNGGGSWIDRSGDLPPNLDCLAMAVDFGEGVIYVGTERGVYLSDDGGQHYLPYGNLNAQVYDMEIRGNFLYAATHGRGIWKAPLWIRTEVEESPEVAWGKVTSDGTLLLSSPRSGIVKIDVYDGLGRQRMTLSHRVSAGVNRIVLPLPRGVYVLSVEGVMRWRSAVLVP